MYMNLKNANLTWPYPKSTLQSTFCFSSFSFANSQQITKVVHLTVHTVSARPILVDKCRNRQKLSFLIIFVDEKRYELRVKIVGAKNDRYFVC